MLDTASIVVAVISLITSVIVAVVTTWLGYNADQRKSRREAEKLVQKYRDPLLFAAEDLQSRLWGILEGEVLEFHKKSPTHQDALFIYSAYVVGQFFAWTHILRQETQLMPFSLEDERSTRLRSFVEISRKIQGVLLTGKYEEEEGTEFTLWRGHQMAIGELMTSRDSGEDGELLCMGFFEFTKRWKADDNVEAEQHRTLQNWFQSITDGIKSLAVQGRRAKSSNKLRRLQHLLLDLIRVLDPTQQRLDSKGLQQCAPARECPCSSCLDEQRNARKTGKAVFGNDRTEEELV